MQKKRRYSDLTPTQPPPDDEQGSFAWLHDPEVDIQPNMRLPRIFWMIPILIAIGLMIVGTVLIRDEIHTSKLQADWLSWYGKRINFTMQDGVNPALRFPTYGPYNQRVGYAYIPYFMQNLEKSGYTVAAQMRTSDTYNYFLDRTLYPLYHPKTTVGLTLLDRTESPLYSARYPAHAFASYTAIPKLIVDTLLFVENREMMQKNLPPTHNPVIEWKRFAFAALAHIFHIEGTTSGGGSTLATQIEKFRFSPNGQTTSGLEKLRQIASASLRIYLSGQDTREARNTIVLDYINSTPLSARPGYGEVNGMGEGLWAWFGIEQSDVVTALNLPETDADSLRAKARVYRAALGLILAQRRPSAYLIGERSSLETLANATLDRLAAQNIISPALRDATKALRMPFVNEVPTITAANNQPNQKGITALRTNLLGMLGLRTMYEVDRLDLKAQSTMDNETTTKVAVFLKNMGQREFLQRNGFYGFRLLDPDDDPAKIKWSFVLYERTDSGNKLRILADNVDEAFDMNDGMKLDLGSTAKLRTLVTYLEIISELHRRYAGLSRGDLAELAEEAPDALTLWATTWLQSNGDASRREMLEAAMDRNYSGSPNEAFFTGGGLHTFVNFEKSENKSNMDLHEAFRNSVNLSFVRVMRDIVNYTIGQGAETKQDLLGDRDEVARHQYLQRFAEQEGGVFLTRYYNDYKNLSPDAALEKLNAKSRKGATARTILFRSIRPRAEFSEYAAYMNTFKWPETLSSIRLQQLYRDYPVERYNLSDRGYITGINPLELWMVAYKHANPAATRREVMEVSKPVRIDSYAWLFHPKRQHAQDTRIRIILEEEAFSAIQKRWARLGYPFGRLVPSYATAIGSSADRPGALSELVGIILNDGVRAPMRRFERITFGEDTPFQTDLMPTPSTQRLVMDPEVAHLVKSVMADVVNDGTAKRVRGVYLDAKGQPLAVGGKTGTGDQRYDEYGRGGRLISSRVVNRTGTFAFYIGDNYFGTITAHVAGEDAADYTFTSALSAQMLKSLSPILMPLINGQVATAQNNKSAPQP